MAANGKCRYNETLTKAIELIRENGGLKAEISIIKHIANNIDEFDRPIQFDTRIPPLAERIYEQFVEIYEQNERLKEELAKKENK